MVAHHASTIVEKDGSIKVDRVPFPPGQRVRIIVRIEELPQAEASRYPLRGTSYQFDDPFSPVGVDDWEALK